MDELASVTPALITSRSQRWRPEQPRHSGRPTGSARHSQISITTNADTQKPEPLVAASAISVQSTRDEHADG
jgi:hypothetical protein